jgi:hypothetical protein
MPRRVRDRRPHLFRRVARFVRAFFSSGPLSDVWEDGLDGGVGTREPRRPIRPSLSGAVALEAPPAERRDVRAIGEDDGR